MSGETTENHDVTNPPPPQNVDVNGQNAPLDDMNRQFTHVMQAVGAFVTERSRMPKMSDKTIQHLASTAAEIDLQNQLTKRKVMTTVAWIIVGLAAMVTAMIMTCIITGQVDLLKDIFSGLAMFIGGGGGVVIFQRVYQQSTSSSSSGE